MMIRFELLLIAAMVCFGLVFTKSPMCMSCQRQRRNAEDILEDFKSDCSSCGLENFSGLQDMIVSGKMVKPPNRYPWMVSLKTKEGDHICGGALISQQHVLTAAHCLDPLAYTPEDSQGENVERTGGKKKKYVSAELLVIGFLTPTDHETKSRSPVEKIIAHPRYSEKDKKNDIAIIQLQKKIKCDKYANPICLPPSDFKLEENSITIISGWGADEGGAQTPVKELLQGRLKTANFDECLEAAKREKYVRRLADSVYCLNGLDNITACSGDSGGSMFAEYDKRAYSLGLASLHIDQLCAITAPILYTSVPLYMNWITEVTGLELSRPIEENGGLKPLSAGKKRTRDDVAFRNDTREDILKGEFLKKFYSLKELFLKELSKFRGKN